MNGSKIKSEGVVKLFEPRVRKNLYTFEYLESLRLPMIDYELREMTLGFSFL